MINLERVSPGSTIYIPFESFASSSGAPITITNFAVGDIKIYKDGSTTERASTSGFTLLDTDGVDFDGITGIHGFSVDLSDNTTAGFYTSGGRYFVVVSTVTVDGQTMSFLAARFRIGEDACILDTTIATLSSQTSFTLTAGPADDNALKGCTAIIHDAASAVQQCFGYVSAYTGSTKTVTLAVDPAIFTMAAGDNISFRAPIGVHNVAGTAQTAGDIIGRLGTPAGASVSADVAAAKADTAAIKAKTDNLPSDPADASDIAASFTTVNGTLSTIAAYIDTEVAAIKAKTDNLPSDPADASDIAASFSSLNTLLTVTGIVLTAAERTAIAAAMGGRTITEGYRSNGAAPTLDQGISEILGHLGESSIVTTTKTVKKFDHSTTAATFTLNDATTPTSITRAS